MFGRKKQSAIDRRLQELQREMSQVGSEIKNLSHSAKPRSGSAGVEAAPRRFSGFEPEETVFVPAPDKTAPEPVGEGQALPAGEVSPPGKAFPDAAASGGLPLFEQRAPLSTTGREKFANYFMAGHFSNLRPMRQEKRIVRNKAIVMIVLAVLALILVLYFW